MNDCTKMSVDTPEKVFFTADPHFFHEAIIGHCDRPFKDAAHMNECLILNWNAVVPTDGKVFVLGDVFYTKAGLEKCEKVMQRLNGRKWLIAGNHDYLTRQEYLDLGFEDARDYLELSIEKQKVVLSHYPLLEWNGFYRGSWHLFGHAHGNGSHFSWRVLDVGVDVFNYAPLSWAFVKGRLSGGFEKDIADMKMRRFTTRHQPYIF